MLIIAHVLSPPMDSASGRVLELYQAYYLFTTSPQCISHPNICSIPPLRECEALWPAAYLHVLSYDAVLKRVALRSRPVCVDCVGR